TKEAGGYEGMKAIEAREKIVADLGDKIVKIEPYPHRVSICYRCNSLIEPIPSMQWFLKMNELARKAIDVVKLGKVHIVPERFEKTYFDWLENIRDWTISRQIWWGHQLPIYFCKNKQEEFSISNFQLNKKEITENFVVAIEKPKECPFCKSCEMVQAEDVMDTWFSSALWPFAGLSESDRKNYYPGHTLITARDILNLWVARMIYSGIEFMEQPPFQNVLIHGTIMTKDGKRMSKSLGTGIDPLKYIDEYGADVARFAVVWQATGQDIRWDETAVTGGRKFTNKIWNAAKFVVGNLQPTTNNARQAEIPEGKTDADKKILEELNALKTSVGKDIETFEFSKALHDAYEFFWHSFCDVYLEVGKVQLKNEEQKESTRAILFYVLKESLKIMHPFMPFITEAIYEQLPIANRKLLLVTQW
ncbi:MAG: class I tRNA ligase family protein, partial [Patescibacteria group bacterium]